MHLCVHILADSNTAINYFECCSVYTISNISNTAMVVSRHNCGDGVG